jgi:hypothetical protein
MMVKTFCLITATWCIRFKLSTLWRTMKLRPLVLSTSVFFPRKCSDIKHSTDIINNNICTSITKSCEIDKDLYESFTINSGFYIRQRKLCLLLQCLSDIQNIRRIWLWKIFFRFRINCSIFVRTTLRVCVYWNQNTCYGYFCSKIIKSINIHEGQMKNGWFL